MIHLHSQFYGFRPEVIYHMKIIGRIDKADFPELTLENIAIKIDTGAYTSSIHSHDISELIENNEKILEFEILDPAHTHYHDKKFRTKNYKVKAVKSSNGVVEKRFFVKTEIVIFGKNYPIQLSLTNRGEMKYPILLGRRFLNKKVLVDTTLKNVSFDLKQAKQ